MRIETLRALAVASLLAMSAGARTMADQFSYTPHRPHSSMHKTMRRMRVARGFKRR